MREYEHCDILSKYNLPLSNKLLLHGKSGCGNTMTVRAIAHKPDKNIKVINPGGIVSSKPGETSANIASAFRLVESQEADIKNEISIDSIDLKEIELEIGLTSSAKLIFRREERLSLMERKAEAIEE